jgi:hypothetical protein
MIGGEDVRLHLTMDDDDDITAPTYRALEIIEP